MTSHYPFPYDLVLGLARDIPAGHRSFVSDCRKMRARMRPEPMVLDADKVPTAGPAVIAANHYQRRGLWIGWPGAVITAAVADRRGDEPPIHWLVTGGLRLCQWRRSGPEVPLARSLLAAVARTYGMAALPLTGARERSAAVKTWLTWVCQGEAGGIFPEGLEGTSEGLRRPAAGFTSLCRVLGREGVPLVPCGIHEQDETLVLRFGDPLLPRLLAAGAGGDRVMEAIAALLPPELRGAYAAAGAASGALD